MNLTVILFSSNSLNKQGITEIGLQLFISISFPDL